MKNAGTKRAKGASMPISFSRLHVCIVLLLITQIPLCDAKMLKVNDFAITNYRHEYDSGEHQQDLIHDQASDFTFQRFLSPATVKNALKNANSKSDFKWFQGKDGRKGYVSSTKLSGDWVLAESEQIAVKCTTEEVIRAYLSGDLQQQWNSKEVLKCSFQCKTGGEDQKKDFIKNQSKFLRFNSSSRFGKQIGKYYQQDLVLRSQRIIRSHTGIMRYCQIITVDKIGKDSYSILVRLDPEQQGASSTAKKPFESLSVYVGLQQKGENASIYAAGVMQVNRKVVPNLVIFDASGIAGGMAGKGTLWLAGFFEKRLSGTGSSNKAEQ